MHELNKQEIAALLPPRRVQSNKGSYGSVAAAAGAVVAQGGTVQLIHGFAARCLVQAINILGDNGF